MINPSPSARLLSLCRSAGFESLSRSMSCSPCGLTVGFLPPCMVCVCMCVWPRPCCRSLHVCLSLRLSPLLPFSLGQPAERLLPSPPAPEHRRALEGLLSQHAGHHPAPTQTKLHPGRSAWLGLNSFWVYYHFHWYPAMVTEICIRIDHILINTSYK